jgi:[protein-PII] uridylyltransferase
MSSVPKSPKPRPARIADVIDGARLRAQLTAAALDHGGDHDAARKRAIQLLHGALFRGRMIAKERLEMGAGGHETARLLAAVADEVIRALHDFTTVHMIRSRNPTAGERFAIVAVGGFGRGQLAPSSDIDLLFLRPYKQTAWAESVTEYVLYALWDMSLKVGHSSRTIEECLRLARDDHTIQTALLEARHIAGDADLTEELKRRYRKDVALPGHRAFMTAKLNERSARHNRQGASQYMVEPNLKEGVGALRDLHAMFWILKHQYGFDNPWDYAREGVFTREEVASAMRASDFFWRARCHLHYLTGRAEERLSFDLQPELAQRMGFGDRGAQPAVERFMKRYFLAAKDVGSLSRILDAKFDAEARKANPFGAFLGSTRKPASGPFEIKDGRMNVRSQDALDADPVNILRLFALAAAGNLEVHPEGLAAASRRLKLITPGLRADPRAQRAFLEAAAGPAPPKALRQMNESGVLGRFMPEFGRIVAQMQFNMYHHFTVDEHTLRAVDVIHEIERGAFKAEHPLSTELFPKIINRRALYMAMLLHDTGKGEGDQQIEGEKSARAACERLGLPAEEVDLVGWLVRHHLLMSDVAQKRDISDPRTIASFAEAVGEVERLRLLLVLTVADIRAVGPGVWNGWKGQLLRDLYRLTEMVLHGGHTDESGVRERVAEQALQARDGLIKSLHSQAFALGPWLDSLDDAYWVSFAADALKWHAQEAEKALCASGPHVAARASPDRGVTEILLYTDDRPGLFAQMAAVFAAAGADVPDARVHTTKDGKAFDLFSVQNAMRGPFGGDDPAALKRLLAELKRAAVDPSILPTPHSRAPARRAAAFRIEPWVRVDNDVARRATVVEVSGRDRSGLLADLAREFAAADLSIVSAHIDAYGARVADVFYVQDLSGEKLTDEARITALTARLVAVLREGEPGAPADPKRQPLAVARASEAR